MPRALRHAVTQPLDKPYRLIPLTQGQNAIVDTKDFEWLSQWPWYAAWCEETRSFYAQRRGKEIGTIKMHRLILACDSKERCDHKNHDTLDNRRQNIRKCTQAQNAKNRRKGRDNTSGFKGVSLCQGRWLAQITLNNVLTYIGSYDTPKEAAKAYDEAAKFHYGEFAHPNFPPSES